MPLRKEIPPLTADDHHAVFSGGVMPPSTTANSTVFISGDITFSNTTAVHLEEDEDMSSHSMPF